MKASHYLKSAERGEGQVGSIVMLILMFALALAAADVGPMYWDNYKFEDRIAAVAGGFPPNKDGDVRAMAATAKAVEDVGLLPYLDPKDCTVTSGGGIGGLRTVTCIYTRDYKLFGSRKTKEFDVSISRPMF